MRYWCLLIVMMTTVVLMAADPVGKVTSSGPLTLNGKTVPGTATSSLPLVAGDVIVTSSSPAVISFSDNCRATIEPNSRVKLEAYGSSVGVRVLSGSVDLKRAQGSRVTLIGPSNPAAGRGPGQSDSHHPCKDHKPPPRSEHRPPDHDCDRD